MNLFNYARKPVAIFKGDADKDRPNILPSDCIEKE